MTKFSSFQTNRERNYFAVASTLNGLSNQIYPVTIWINFKLRTSKRACCSLRFLSFIKLQHSFKKVKIPMLFKKN